MDRNEYDIKHSVIMKNLLKKINSVKSQLQNREKRFLIEAETAVPSITTKIKNVPICAETEEKAIEIFEHQLQDGETLINISKKTSPIPGIIFLSIPIIMSYFPFYDGFDSINLFPDMLSTLIATIIYSSFVIRIKGMKNTFKGIMDIIISLMIILLMGIVLKFFVGDNSIFGNGLISKFLKLFSIKITKSHLIIIAIILSWLGIRQISGFLWLIIIGLGLTEFATCGKYLGNVQGTLFVLSAFCGCIFYLKYEGRLIINSFSNMTYSISHFFKHDIDGSLNYAKQQLTKLKESKRNKELANENK